MMNVNNRFAIWWCSLLCAQCIMKMIINLFNSKQVILMKKRMPISCLSSMDVDMWGKFFFSLVDHLWKSKWLLYPIFAKANKLLWKYQLFLQWLFVCVWCWLNHQSRYPDLRNEFIFSLSLCACNCFVGK